jgi:hypothetical protein
VPGGELVGIADVQQEHSVAGVEIPPVHQRVVPAQAVGRDHPGQVDGILGCAVLRRVAQLGLLEVEDRRPHLKRQRDHVDAPRRSFLADGLGSENAAVAAIEAELQVDRPRARVVARVVSRVEVDGLGALDAGTRQCLLAGAGHRDGEPEGAADRSGLDAAEAGRAPEDRVRRDASLAIRRTREGGQHLGARDHVANLHGVPDGEDVRVAGPHVGVDADPTARPELEAAVAGQSALRFHPDGQQDQVGGKLQAGLRLHHQALRGRVDRRQPVAQVDGDAFGLEPLLHPNGQLGIERRHHLVGQLDDAHLQAAMAQVLDHFQADEAATDYHGSLGAVLLDPRANPAAVGNRAEDEHARPVDTGQRRYDGAGAGCEHELRVALASGPAIAQILHLDLSALAVDGRHLAPRARLDVEALREQLGGCDEQLLFVADHVADEVGKAAVRKGDEGSPVEDDDLAALAEPACPRGGRCPAGDAADDQNPFGFVHGSLLAPRLFALQ